MRKIFITATDLEAGKDWDFCWFGTDMDGREYGVTSNSMHSTDFFDVYTHGPKKDAELVAKLLNAYYGNQDIRAAVDALGEQPTHTPGLGAFKDPAELTGLTFKDKGKRR